ncbi:hypothetical protein [Paenibacillus sp. Root444D2]|uniref:hypothetical protein n=1 Tax=Paenibacillus sp. Root444D2 TaxID=1736538 RepID=UPI00070A02B9|nr:hypothetical protein [Paenibacillus sp. Root444D2]KQX60821.1 hypothetical protein ASD40_31515 [Paenibacillus sp. Root444D2]
MENGICFIHTADFEGNSVAILTNRFDLSADKPFYETSEQAVMNQEWMALIAYCLRVLIVMGFCSEVDGIDSK